MIEENTNKRKKNLESLFNKAKKRKHGDGEIQESTPSADDNTTGIDNNQYGNFTVIGKYIPSKISKGAHYLPAWFEHPIPVSSDLKTSLCLIDDYELLDKTLAANVRNEGITHFFPVQHQVIPWLLKDIKRSSLYKPRDICVSAPTGSGKTLAYALPIIQSLSRRIVPKIRALIIAPVQELVLQIANVFKVFANGTKLKILATVGGKTPLHVEQGQLLRPDYCNPDSYETLVDILVTTPGRLVEHLENTKGFDLSYLRYLVMDEADRMLNNIQNDWLYHLEKHFNAEGQREVSQLSLSHFLKRKFLPQRLLFSATLSHDPEKLKKLNLYHPVLFSSTTSTTTRTNGDIKSEDFIASVTTPSELKERFMVIEGIAKPLAVCELFQRGWKHVLCFTKSANEAHKLSKLLSFMNPSFNIEEISALLTIQQREKILQDFCSGSIDMLVCSDVMARGIDINNVKYVISYDLPKHISGYIHRVGRTGRAGIKGKALTFVSSSQVNMFHQMMTQFNKKNITEMALDEERLNNWREKYKEALHKLKLYLKDEQMQKNEAAKMEKKALHPKKKRKKKKKKKNV